MYAVSSTSVRRAWVAEATRRVSNQWPASARRRHRRAVGALLRLRPLGRPAPVRS